MSRCRHTRLGIPKRFQLHGHIVTVRILPLSKWPHAKDTLGIYDPNAHRIDVRGDQGDWIRWSGRWAVSRCPK